MTPQTNHGSSSISAPNLPSPVPAGASWRRIDLHLHSPGIKTFTCPDGSDIESISGRAAVVSEFVTQLKSQNISICSITDYNGIRTDWFQLIHEQCRTLGITLLPGAELSFRVGKHGLHIIAVFSEDTETAEVNRFLQALDRDPATPLFDSDRTHRDIDLKENAADSLRKLQDRFECLLIVPHPDQNNGICTSLQPADAAKLLNDIRPDAIEHCPESEVRKLQNTGVLESGFFERLSFVEFSDPKRIAEIGNKTCKDGSRRATFLKLSATDLKALSLALHDPATRLAIDKVPQSGHAKIRTMEVAGSGFLGNLAIAWNDDLNVLIGGRGAGKSAVLESLRYALGLEPYSEHSYRDALVQYALGSGGKLTLTLDRPIANGQTRTYRVVRVLGGEPRVYEHDTGRPVSVQPSELFGTVGPPAIFGQREIHAISASEEYRLRLLDDLIGEEARRSGDAVQESLRRLEHNARSILESAHALAMREQHRQRLKTIDHEISVYERYGLTEKLKSATAFRGDRQRLTNASEILRTSHEMWRDYQKPTEDGLAGAERDLKKAESDYREILNDATSVLAELRRGIDALFEHGDILFNEAIERIRRISQKWQDALLPLEDELNQIKQDTNLEAIDPDRLLRLTEERAYLGPLIDALDQEESKYNELLDERSTIFQAVQDRRLQEHELRRQRAEEIGQSLKARLRLTVEFKGQKEEYRRQLLTTLKGSGVSADAIQRLATPPATDGQALAKAISKGSEELETRFGLTPGMAERLVRWGKDSPSRLFLLDTLLPPDVLHVELNVDGQYRPLDRLSVGQQATAILLLLFALHGRVLVLDQPEDDLDNRFVYEDIVALLRDQKGLAHPSNRRQIIAATHNANIPVLGDAELVLALEGRDCRTRVLARASIDEHTTRQLIKSIMEGGEDAFRKRAEKYGGL